SDFQWFVKKPKVEKEGKSEERRERALKKLSGESLEKWAHAQQKRRVENKSTECSDSKGKATAGKVSRVTLGESHRKPKPTGKQKSVDFDETTKGPGDGGEKS